MCEEEEGTEVSSVAWIEWDGTSSVFAPVVSICTSSGSTSSSILLPHSRMCSPVIPLCRPLKALTRDTITPTATTTTTTRTMQTITAAETTPAISTKLSPSLPPLTFRGGVGSIFAWRGRKRRRSGTAGISFSSTAFPEVVL